MTLAETLTITIPSSLGMTIENIIVFGVFLGSLIFFAKDFRLGLIYLILSNTGLFIAYFSAGWIWVSPVILLFMALVGFALSLYAVRRSAQQGAFI